MMGDPAPDFIPATVAPQRPVSSAAPNFIPASTEPDKQVDKPGKPSGIPLPKAVKDIPAALLADPLGGPWALAKAGGRATLDMAEMAASGAAALAKTMFEPVKVDPKLSPQDQAESNFNQSLDQFTKNYDKIKAALNFTNVAPADKTEQAMSNLLGMLPQAIQKGGDTVYDQTGSALAGAGFMGVATLLSFRPGLAADIVRPAVEKFKSGEPSTLASAFDELAAQHTEAATAVAEHVGQTDVKTAQYLKSRIQKFVDASDKELNKIGVAAAKANIKELEGDYATIKGKAFSGQKADAGTLLPKETLISVEKASASLRTTVKEAQASFNEGPAKVKSAQRIAGGTDDVVEEPEGRVIGTHTEAADQAMLHEGIKNKVKGELLDKLAGPKTVYMNSGIPVSRASVEAAFSMASDVADKIPGVQIARAKLAAQYDKFIDTFNPEARGPEARVAGSRIAQNFFTEAAREHVIWEKSKPRRKYWQAMGDEAGLQFMRDVDAGKKLDNPVQEKARQGYEVWSDRMYQQDLVTGFTYDAVDHYVPRLFVDQEGVRKWMTQKYGNKWADPRFIKDRKFQLITEAEKAGFTLKYKNPEEAMMARQRMSDIAELRHTLLKQLESEGLAIKAGKGETRPPEGYSPDSRRSPTGQRYWVHENIGPLMRNAFDSKSLWEAQGNLGAAFRGYMGLKNTIVPLKLALSAFHPLHVMHIDNAAHLTRSTKLLAERGGGTVAKAYEFVVNVATGIPGTPGALWRSLYDSPKTGYPLLKVFQGKLPMEALNPAQRKAWQYLSESGMIPTRPRQEMNGSMQKMKDAWNESRIPAAAWHLPWALMEGINHPVFGMWIPSLKIASLLKDAEVNLRLNPDLAFDSTQRGVMLRDAARKVESRYGEINYNSMFWNKMYKDIGVASTLSLGWNVGLIDQYAGGAVDAVKAAKNIGLDLLDPNSKGSELGRQVRAGNLDRPIQATLYVSTALMLGGLMHYFMTGKPPEDLLDYTNPKSGDKDQYGRDERLNTMFYTREFSSLYKHMEYEGTMPGLGEFVLNKGSGLGEMMKSALTGVDSLGREVRKPDSPLYLQTAESLAAMYSDLLPISHEAIEKAGGYKATSTRTKILDIAGFTPAGKYISQTKTENLIGDEYNKYVRPKETPYDQVVKSKDFKDLQQAYTKDDPGYDRKLDAAQDKYDLKSADIRRLEKQFRHEDEFDLLKYQFSRLEWPQQRDLLDKMSKEERAVYLPISNKKHLRDNYEEPSQ
jgi:hypothetical protein